MSIDRLRAHYGFTRTPFSKELAPGMLYRSKAHAESVARLAWLIAERACGVLTGEVGAGKTVALRAAAAALDASRHTLIYLAQPGTGVRGIYAEVVRALGATPCFQRSNLVPQAAELLEAEETERGKTWSWWPTRGTSTRRTSWRACACWATPGWIRTRPSPW